MSDGTKIEWTDATANVVNGCNIYSPGCANCYAMRLAGTRLKDHPTRVGLTQPSKAGPVWTGEVRFNEKALQQVLRWTRPRRIFWNAHGDLFHESVPDEWIDRCFAAMALTPQHSHQVLTKRSARMRDYMRSLDRAIVKAFAPPHQHPALDDPHAEFFASIAPHAIAEWPLPNVWLGVSVEDQIRADERIPDLLATPAAVRWISAEPLLGPLDLRWIAEPDEEKDGVLDALLGCNWIERENGEEFRPARPGHQDRIIHRWVCSPEADILANRKLDWIVAGGESGPRARPMHPDWARSLRDQCKAAGVPFLFKQWGEWHPAGEPVEIMPNGDGIFAAPGAFAKHWFGEEVLMLRVGKKQAGRLLDGARLDGYPG